MTELEELTRQVDEALALMRWPEDQASWRAGDDLLATAMAAVGLPRHVAKRPDGTVVSFESRHIPRAGELTALQRAVLEHIARIARLRLTSYPFPSAGWARRQWLGLEPPGPLFTETEGRTYFEIIRQLLTEDPDGDPLECLQSLPAHEQVALLAELHLLTDDAGWMMDDWLGDILGSIDSSCAGWASSFAPRLLDLYATPQAEREASSIDVLRWPTFAALARSGQPIDPSFDVLLPVSRSGVVKPAFLQECIHAIPEQRREGALLAGLANVTFGNDAVTLGAALLAAHPYPSIARFVLERLDQAWKPEDALRTVQTVAKDHPTVLAALDAFESNRPPVPELRAASRLKPPQLTDLDPVAQAQLEAAARRYSGDERTAKQILAGGADDDGAILPSTIERIRIEDAAGNHAYDAWLYMGDSGTIFEAGTTTVVAERVQAGLEAKDEPVRLALLDALGPPVTAPDS